MPSLVGNKPNQVPTNGDLGTLAFQDSNAVNITGGVVDVSAGTAALPTLGTTGDPNTGVFFPAADTVAVATNGVEVIRLDSTGNLGLGVTPSTWASGYKSLEVGGIGNALVSNGGTDTRLYMNTYYNASANNTYARTGAAALYAMVSTGQHQWFTAPSGTAGTTPTFTQAMTLNASGNLSIGTTTSQAPLQIAKDGIASGAGWTSVLKATDSANNKGIDFGYDASSQTSIIVANTASTASNLAFWTYTGSAWGERMRINSAGNLGLGTTPSAWGVGKAIELGGVGAGLWNAGTAGDIFLTSNAYYNAGWKYAATNASTYYEQNAGVHRWSNAPSGTAGNAITFTQAMTLDANGNLLIGGTTGTTVSPDIRIILTTTTGAYMQFARSTGSGGAAIGTSGSTFAVFTYTGATGSEVYTQRTFVHASGGYSVGNSTDPGVGRIQAGSTPGTGQGTATPNYISSDSTFGNNAAGSNGNLKFILFNTSAANSNYGLGLSSGLFEFTTGIAGTFGWYVNGATPTRVMALDASGNLTIGGATAIKSSGTTWTNPSDIRLKDNVTDYSKGLAELMQVNVKEWTYNGKGGTTEGMKGLGVIADEVMTVLPDTVDTYQAKLNAKDKNDTDIKKFDATEITWLMLNAIKEQQAMIDELKAKVAALEAA